MAWQAIVSSAKGTKHIKDGKPCQDCGDYSIISDGDVIIGAVSDGMGSAKHSNIGSKLAVEATIFSLKQKMTDSQLQSEEQAKEVFRYVVENVRLEFKNWSNKNGNSTKDLACTLLAFIASSKWLAAMQIGDGLIVIRSQEKDYQLLFQPDKGEFANETTSITSSDALDKMQILMKSMSCQFICMATDGIENISLLKKKSWIPYDKFFIPLEQHIMSKSELYTKNKILSDFLNSNKINQKIDDDKTILLCSYKS